MTDLSTVSHRRVRLSVMAAAAMVALSGCASLHPGAAAVVDSSTISHGEVDDVTMALCSANITGAEAQGQPAPDLATRGAREGALQVLLESELSRQFGEEMHVGADERLLSQALAQNEQNVALLPEDRRDDFRSALRKYAGGQLILIEIGRQSLTEQGQAEVTDDLAIAEGQRLRGEFVATIEIEVDPRYGTFAEGTFETGGSELSVPASDGGLAGAKADPGPGFVAALPASQRCS